MKYLILLLLTACATPTLEQSKYIEIQTDYESCNRDPEQPWCQAACSEPKEWCK